MDIKSWEEKMKEKIKNTPFRDYVRDIMSHRTLAFYKNNGFTSIFPNSDRIKGVISHHEYEEQKDSRTNHGLTYNFSQSFFENYQSLMLNTEYPPTNIWRESNNSSFTDQTVSASNGYLSFVLINDCENILYSFSVKEGSRNVINSVLVWDNCENIYYSKGVIKSFNIFYSKYVMNSANVWFSTNMIGCQECIMCDGLENASYYIKNKKYEKDDYRIEKERILKEKNDFEKYYEQMKNSKINIASHNVEGVFNIECHDCSNAYYNYMLKNSRNIVLVGGKAEGEEIYDVFTATPPINNIYGAFSVGYCDNVYNSTHMPGGSSIYYSQLCEGCNHIIGCIGLKNKEYCILNKEYTKEERYKLANQIFQSMEWDGVLGEFFPGWLCPYYFNDTASYLLDDTFTKEEVTERGFLWRDEQISVDIPDSVNIIDCSELDSLEGYDDNGNWIINPEIMKRVIKDDKGDYYRIVKMEYDFLMKHGLPLPRSHWMERMKRGLRI